MRRPAILALGLLVLFAILAGRWWVLPSPVAAKLAVPAVEAPPDVDVDSDAAAVALAPVEPERSPALVAVGETNASGGHAQPAPEVGTIRGRVVNDSGDPLEGARVQAEPQAEVEEDAPTLEAVSDSQGRFTLGGGTPQEQYELKAELDGWWPVEQVIRSTGATGVELVLQRGGGMRGQALEALDTRVEDYIVVVRYESPPIDLTPETMARFERSVRRSMRRSMRDQLRAGMLTSESSTPEQRPDGEAWTVLGPDGRFEFTNLMPGKSSVIIAARHRTRGLATFAGVEVQPGVVSEDARLNPVHMNEHACIYGAAIADQDGVVVPQGTLEVLPVEKDAHGKFTIEFKDGAARFLGPLWIDTITVGADGYSPVMLRGPSQDIAVVLAKLRAEDEP